MQYFNEYLEIGNFYKDKKAKRSGLPLMNHINEGINILRHMDASPSTIGAYCLHPMIQGDEGFIDNFRILSQFRRDVIILLLEYRRAANPYLCKPYTDEWGQQEIGEAVGYLMPEVKEMLIADKQQNQKDFIAHHYGLIHGPVS